jgi:hypothetical protein
MWIEWKLYLSNQIQKGYRPYPDPFQKIERKKKNCDPGSLMVRGQKRKEDRII